MKFWQWCAQDPRRYPRASTLATESHPHHVWFGSNWHDETGDRWVAQWAPLTGELYAVNGDWDVRPLGRIPDADHVQVAFDGVRGLQGQRASLVLLTALLDEAPAVWGPDLDPGLGCDPGSGSDMGVEL